MSYDISAKIEEYVKLINEKQAFLTQLRNTTATTIKEIDVISGAIQALQDVVKHGSKEIETNDERAKQDNGK